MQYLHKKSQCIKFKRECVKQIKLTALEATSCVLIEAFTLCETENMLGKTKPGLQRKTCATYRNLIVAVAASAHRSRAPHMHVRT